jgi:hypothetical protein
MLTHIVLISDFSKQPERWNTMKLPGDIQKNTGVHKVKNHIKINPFTHECNLGSIKYARKEIRNRRSQNKKKGRGIKKKKENKTNHRKPI